MRFSKAVDKFLLLPPASSSLALYSTRLISIAKSEAVTLFLPVSGAGSSIEDAHVAQTMFTITQGKCRTFIQDPETMADLHDKNRFMALVDSLGFKTPKGQLVESTEEAIAFLQQAGGKPSFVLKCLDLDENRGDMTLYPLRGDTLGLSQTMKALKNLSLKISKTCPYVLQQFIPGQGEFLLIVRGRC